VARVEGLLETMEFTPGSNVKAGQLLFTIEELKYRAARDDATAGLAGAEANLLRAETELNRVERASKSKAVSANDVDRARAERDQAIAAVASAHAHLDQAQQNYDYTQVVSPIDGDVSRNLVDIGNLVGQSGSTVLTRVNTLEPIFVYFHAPETLVLRYLETHKDVADRDTDKAGKGLAMVARATDTGFPFEGKLDFVDNQVNPETGTIEMRVVLTNEDRNFFPGLFVRVKMFGEAIEDAVMVPELALGTDLGGKYILTVGEGNIVEQHYVTLGMAQEGGMVHIREGLTGEETIIVSGLMFARPGLPVTPLTAEQFAAMQQQAAQ
jgi:multidrug efflux system membrane fusion protein